MHQRLQHTSSSNTQFIHQHPIKSHQASRYNQYTNTNTNTANIINQKSKFYSTGKITRFGPTNYNSSSVNVQNNNNNNPAYQHHHLAVMNTNSYPIYEGVDPLSMPYNLNTFNRNQINGLNNTANYSNANDYDPSLFNPNEYDNATLPSNLPTNQRATLKPPVINGTIDKSNNNNNIGMSANFDRVLSFKSNIYESGDLSLTQPTSASIGTGFPDNLGNNSLSMRFETIRKNCFATKTLFQDPEFPPTDSSLYRQFNPVIHRIKWLRPQEIVEIYNQRNGTNLQAEFIVNGFEKCDLNQGDLGDCWVVASIAAIVSCEHERFKLIHRLIPAGQTFRGNWYAGCFQFRFWRNGEWRDVIVDDYLPTINGQLCFISSYQSNEFWGPLIEKAYAKINGCYGALDRGMLADAMDDFTGGMTESYSLNQQANQLGLSAVPKNIDDEIIKAFECHSLVTCGIYNTTDTVVQNVVLPNGLVSGHAYTVSDIRKIRLSSKVPNSSPSVNSKIVTLIRIRNPWGNKVEWNGAWSDNSTEWLGISEADRRAVGLVFDWDGEFWMSLTDFLFHFHTIDICHLPYQPMSGNQQATPRHYWDCEVFFGEWVPGVSAGGRPKCINTHYINPKMRLDVHQTNPLVPTSNVLIGLLQEDRRGAEPSIAGDNLSIGFVIYPLPKTFNQDVNSLGASFFRNLTHIASVDSFVNSREVVKRVSLPAPGKYIIVPSTFDAGIPGKFLLRVLTNCESKQHESNQAPPSTLQARLTTNTNVNVGSGSTTRDIVIRQLIYREAGSEMSLNASQLHRVINTLLKDRCSPIQHQLDAESCKYLLLLFSSCNDVIATDSTIPPQNRLHETQFSVMWTWLLKALRLIQAADTLGPLALRTVLDSSGVLHNIPSVSRVIRNLTGRFAINESNHVTISGFISILATLTYYKEIFDQMQTNNTITLNKEEFLNIVTKM